MIEPLYGFNLTADQERQAKALHEESIILDMLFQGPVGTYSLPEQAEDELLSLARQACPNDEPAQCAYIERAIYRRMIDGEYADLYRDCWYESGLTGGCRQISVSGREEALWSAVALQEEFDKKPWLKKCTSVEEIRRCKSEGTKAGIVTSQESLGYGKDLKLLELLYDFGLRVQQLTYNNHNLIGAGCMEPNAAGLSKFGVQFVQKCNELGIVVDTGHCGKGTTLDACKYSGAPVIASHTGAEKIFFHERCKSDEELAAIAETGGVVGIFAMPWFIASDPENTTVDHFLDHIDYVVKLTGTDHVGIGTDWPMPQTKWMALTFKKYVAPSMGFAPGDGPSTEWVRGLKDYRSFINITRGLVARGYADSDIKKILGENWLRVFGQVWK
jgi:membrane dipeptidase